MATSEENCMKSVAPQEKGPVQREQQGQGPEMEVGFTGTVEALDHVAMSRKTEVNPRWI